MQINKFPLIVKRILMAEVIGQAHQLGQNEKAKKNQDGQHKISIGMGH